MKQILILGLFVSLIACSGSQKTSQIPEANILDFVETITTEGLKADLSVLAHDSLEGRDTGSKGLEKAAKYLSGRYKALGLTPVGDNNTYEQHFDLTTPITNSYEYILKDANGTVVDHSKLTKTETSNFSTIFGGSDNVSGDIVFVGLGISDKENGVNQIPEGVAGKWLMMFSVQGVTNTRALQQQMAKDGAAGVILIYTDGVEEFDKAVEAKQSSLGSRGRMSLAYMQSDAQKAPQQAWQRIHPELAAKLLGLETSEQLTELSASIQEAPASFEAKALNYSLEHKVDAETVTVTTSNMVAFLEGSDPKLKDEVVVLSSHYDHVGIGRPDSTGDTIYNGADDDGSGTTGVLNTAQAMIAAKNAGAGPRRSVLFLHVAGEEKGLLGSRYYSDHPIYSIENTVANINVDMIGRVDKEHEDNKDFIYVIGGEIISSGLDSLLQEANAASVNIDLSKRYNDLNDPNQFYRRSDHWNFGRLGIPFIFFFNGVHADYHRPSDQIENIEWGPLTKRTKLLYVTTAMIANSDERPIVDNQEFIEKTRSQSRN